MADQQGDSRQAYLDALQTAREEMAAEAGIDPALLASPSPSAEAFDELCDGPRLRREYDRALRRSAERLAPLSRFLGRFLNSERSQ